MNPKISVLVVDDHNRYREGIVYVLERSDIIEKIMQAADGKEALEMLRRKPAHVTLMDIRMPKGMNGYDAAIKIRDEKIKTKVIAISMFDAIGNIDMMLQAGAMGFITKNTDHEELEEAITTVLSGHYYFSRILLPEALDILKELENPSAVKQDTHPPDAFERKIIAGLCKGKTNEQISEANSVSVGDVKYHLKKMYSRYGVINAPELIHYLHHNGLMDL